MDKDLKKIAKALREQGFTVEFTKKGHMAVYREGHFIVMFAGTPSDWRSIKNALAAARRAGFRWPP